MIRTEQLTPDYNDLPSVAALYARVFAGSPWNEVTKCASTGDFFGKNTGVGDPCPDCQTPLIEAYPNEDTVKYILGELGKSNPIGLLATIRGELAGFSWAYQTQIDNLVTKWDTADMQDTIHKLLSEYGVDNSLLYGSEAGVAPQFQGQGIGKKLVNNWLQEVKSSNTNFMLIRTNVNSAMYGICKQLSEFDQILGPISNKNPFSGRYSRTGKNISGLDSENIDRVLFLYDKDQFQKGQDMITKYAFRGF